MKKIFPLLFLFALILLPKSVFAMGEICNKTATPASSVCCKAPAIIEQVGGCPSGTKWIGDAATGQCKPTITCPDLTYNYLNCLNGSCYKPAPPADPLACTYANVNTDSSKTCCLAGQVSVRTTDYDNYPSGWRCSDNVYVLLGRLGIGTDTPDVALDVEVASGGAATIGSSGNSATGNFAVAMGLNTVASGLYSTAMGNGTTASNSSSTAMGYLSTASGLYSLAMGSEAVANNEGSVAIGYHATASGYASVAMVDTDAESLMEVTVGRFNVTNVAYSPTLWVPTDPLFVIGNGTSAVATANAFTVLKNGTVGIGTATPNSSYKLDVAGSVQATAYCMGGACLTVLPQGAVGWLGPSTTARDGARGGYASVDTECKTSFPTELSARVCSVEDILTLNRLGLLPAISGDGTAWINGGPPGFTATANDCVGWTNNATTGAFGRYWQTGATSAAWLDNCSIPHRFACCK